MGFYRQVGPEGLRADVSERWQIKSWRKGKGNTIIARDLWRIEQEKFVDDASCESGTV